MNRYSLAAFIFMCFAWSVMAGFCDPCETTLTLQPEYQKITIIARCTFCTFGSQDNHIVMQGNHTVDPGDRHAVCQANGYCGTTIVVSPYAASTTYGSYCEFKATEFVNPIAEIAVADHITTPDAQRPRDNFPEECLGHPWLCDPNYECPLIVNIGQGPWRLTDVDSGVRFDMDADGNLDRTSWTASDTSLALIAIDVNGNGSIDDGSELVGEHMRLPDGSLAANGFVFLAANDDSHDDRIDAADPIWSRLLVWIDGNHDGISQPAELRGIATSGIAALEIEYRGSHRRDSFGNELRFVSSMRMTGGRSEQYYDVFFVMQ